MIRRKVVANRGGEKCRQPFSVLWDEQKKIFGIEYRSQRLAAGIILEGVLILRNSSRKLKAVADNAILLNITASSENISERIKVKTENGIHLKVNVCKFR